MVAGLAPSLWLMLPPMFAAGTFEVTRYDDTRGANQGDSMVLTLGGASAGATNAQPISARRHGTSSSSIGRTNGGSHSSS